MLSQTVLGFFLVTPCLGQTLGQTYEVTLPYDPSAQVKIVLQTAAEQIEAIDSFTLVSQIWHNRCPGLKSMLDGEPGKIALQAYESRLCANYGISLAVITPEYEEALEGYSSTPDPIEAYRLQGNRGVARKRASIHGDALTSYELRIRKLERVVTWEMWAAVKGLQSDDPHLHAWVRLHLQTLQKILDRSIQLESSVRYLQRNLRLRENRDHPFSIHDLKRHVHDADPPEDPWEYTICWGDGKRIECRALGHPIAPFASLSQGDLTKFLENLRPN